METRPKSKAAPISQTLATSTKPAPKLIGATSDKKKVVIKGSIRESLLGQGGKRKAAAMDNQHIPSRIRFTRSTLKPLPKDDATIVQSESPAAAEASASAASSTSGNPLPAVGSGPGTEIPSEEEINPGPGHDREPAQADVMDTRKHQLQEFQRAAFQRRFDLKKRALQLQQEKQNAATTASASDQPSVPSSLYMKGISCTALYNRWTGPLLMNALLWVTFFGTYPCSGCEPSRWSTPYCWNRGLLQTLG